MVAPLALAGIAAGIGALVTTVVKALSSDSYAVVWLRHRKAGRGERGHATHLLNPNQLHPGGQPIHPSDHDNIVREVVGKTFTSLSAAEAYQTILAEKHYVSSIIVHQASDGALDALNPIKAMQPPKRAPKAAYNPGKSMGPSTIHPGMVMEGNLGANANTNASSYHRVMDKRQVAMDNLSVTSEGPTPDWEVQSRFGPYFDHGPMYDDTPSSHNWGIPPIETRVIPEKYRRAEFKT
jgi:hypothetical protein